MAKRPAPVRRAKKKPPTLPAKSVGAGYPCGPVKPSIGKNPSFPNGKVLVGSACCLDGVVALAAGVNAVGKSHPNTNKHLTPFAATAVKGFNAGALLEYCVIVFGLEESQKEQLTTFVQRTLTK